MAVASPDPPPSNPPQSGCSSHHLSGLDALEQSGDRLAQGGDPEAALEAYRRALFVLGDERGPRRVVLYVKIGDLSVRVGRKRVALNNYLKALSLDALHVRAYQGAVALLLADGELSEVDALQARRIEALGSEADRVEAYRAYASLWLDYVKDARRGLAALNQLLALRPDDSDGLGRLAIAWEHLGGYDRAIEAYSMLAAGLRGPEAAAVFRYAAELARDKKGDHDGAVSLAERAVFADPNDAGLVELVERLFDGAGGARRLSAVYDFVIAHGRDPRHSLEIAKKLGALAKDTLRDLALAERAFARAIEIESADADLVRTLAVVQAAQGRYDRALEQCRIAVRMEPREPAGHRLSLGIFERMGNADAARLSASVIACLGDADPHEEALAASIHPEGLLPVRRALVDEDWHGGLLFPEREQAVHALVARLAPFVVPATLDAMQREKTFPSLPAEERHDLEVSTATMARALLWTARVLAAPTPALYLRGEVPGWVEHVRSPTPILVASRGLGAGLSPRQLAFLWGRALVALRPEHSIAVLFASPGSLSDLLESCTRVVRGTSKRVARGSYLQVLERAIVPSERAGIAGLLERVGDLEVAAKRWFASYELTATRAALLCSGDIVAAASLLTTHPFGQATTPSEQIDDLLVWAASDAHQALRRRIGVAPAPGASRGGVAPASTAAV